MVDFKFPEVCIGGWSWVCHPYIVSATTLSDICLWTKNIESYFSDQLNFSNTRSRTSRQIYRLALALLSLEMLSSLSKLRILLFNVHLALFVRKMK